MQSGNVNDMLSLSINTTLASVVSFVPRFVSGLILLLLGIVIGAFLKQLTIELFKFIKLEAILKRYGVPESRDGLAWSNVLGELLRWFVIVLFLVPAADVWGLSKFVDVLNNLIAFLPNVFVAVLLLLIGFVVSRLVHDLLLSSIHGLSQETAKTVATVGRWSVIIFVLLAALSQLGIAGDLIRILFSGLVAMLALAGGLAFGLGGKDLAREILDKLKNRL